MVTKWTKTAVATNQKSELKGAKMLRSLIEKHTTNTALLVNCKISLLKSTLTLH